MGPASCRFARPTYTKVFYIKSSYILYYTRLVHILIADIMAVDVTVLHLCPHSDHSRFTVVCFFQLSSDHLEILKCYIEVSALIWDDF